MRPIASVATAPINLDHPGTYLHWSIFTVSVANLVLIADVHIKTMMQVPTPMLSTLLAGMEIDPTSLPWSTEKMEIRESGRLAETPPLPM